MEVEGEGVFGQVDVVVEVVLVLAFSDFDLAEVCVIIGPVEFDGTEHFLKGISVFRTDLNDVGVGLRNNVVAAFGGLESVGVIAHDYILMDVSGNSKATLRSGEWLAVWCCYPFASDL